MLRCQIPGIMHLSPAANQHSLKDTDVVLCLLQHLSDLPGMHQHSIKLFRLPLASFPLCIIHRAKYDILPVLHKKTENASDIFQCLMPQRTVPVCPQIDQYQRQSLTFPQTPPQFLWMDAVFCPERVDFIPAPCRIFQLFCAFPQFFRHPFPLLINFHIYPAHLRFPHPVSVFFPGSIPQ